MDKVVLITGASSGIGKVTADYLSKNGYIVYGTSRNPEKTNVQYFKMIALDVTDTQSIRKAVQTVIDAEGRIDVLVNNAGKGITGAIEETPTEEMRKAFETNYFGVIEMMKAVIPQMRKQRSGLIINVTSVAGYMGLPFRGIYSAIKGAVEITTEAIRMEVKEFGISVTNVAPGDFATNIAANRYHTPVLKDSPYREIYKKNIELMDKHVDEGSDPVEMARIIHRIIQTKNPKIHYKVGSFLQKFSIVLKRILPDKYYEKLIMDHYGMK